MSEQPSTCENEETEESESDENENDEKIECNQKLKKKKDVFG